MRIQLEHNMKKSTQGDQESVQNILTARKNIQNRVTKYITKRSNEMKAA
jgi:DNA-binding FadR family transcriptional regulator